MALVSRTMTLKVILRVLGDSSAGLHTDDTRRCSRQRETFFVERSSTKSGVFTTGSLVSRQGRKCLWTTGRLRDDKHGLKPDSGKPTVRDSWGNPGNVSKRCARQDSDRLGQGHDKTNHAGEATPGAHAQCSEDKFKERHPQARSSLSSVHQKDRHAAGGSLPDHRVAVADGEDSQGTADRIGPRPPESTLRMNAGAVRTTRWECCSSEEGPSVSCRSSPPPTLCARDRPLPR